MWRVLGALKIMQRAFLLLLQAERDGKTSKAWKTCGSVL